MPNSQKNLYKKLYGKRGEDLAVNYLKDLGYKILERNYAIRQAEADVIIEKDNKIIFVEVKSRTTLKYGTPSEAVNYRKQKKYRELALIYLQKKGLENFEISFAVVEVVGEQVSVIWEAF